MTIASQVSFKNTSAWVSLLNLVWPVGSIYISTSSSSPANLLGGTWSKLENRFLLGSSSSYALGGTGGASTHTLTVAQIPSHNHRPKCAKAVGGSGVLVFATLGESSESSAANSYNFPVTTNTGSGQAHNNMPPYLSVTMYKRTG